MTTSTGAPGPGGATTGIMSRTIRLEVPGAPPMPAYLAHPVTHATASRAGVLVGMELFGLSAHVREVCDWLAGLGYLALAPDLYHRTGPGAELEETAAGREQGFALLGQLTRNQVLADLAAAHDHLRAAGAERAAMVGLSVGGHAAYLAATELDLAAVVVAYGGWIPTTDLPMSRPEPTLARTGSITARVLLLVGSQDQLIPPTQRRQITTALDGANIRHEMVEYEGAGHGFLNPHRASYHPSAARDAWQRVEHLLAEELT